MNKNMCESCGTENEVEYSYCKNCGNPLKKASFTEEQEAQPRGFDYGSQNDVNLNFMEYEGVSTVEMNAFIGAKANNFLPKFTKMQLCNSKTSWTWPAAILGFLLGPLGSALWFFYRKMYKTAIIFAVIGAVITVLTGVMTAGISSTLTEGVLEEGMEMIAEGNFSGFISEIEAMEGAVPVKDKILSTVADIITQASELGAALVSGIYGMYFYKSHCIRKIKEYRTNLSDQRFYKMGLISLGGTSGGMLALGLLIMIVASSIVNLITTLILLV